MLLCRVEMNRAKVAALTEKVKAQRIKKECANLKADNGALMRAFADLQQRKATRKNEHSQTAEQIKNDCTVTRSAVAELKSANQALMRAMAQTNKPIMDG